VREKKKGVAPKKRGHATNIARGNWAPRIEPLRGEKIPGGKSLCRKRGFRGGHPRLKRGEDSTVNPKGSINYPGVRLLNKKGEGSREGKTKAEVDENKGEKVDVTQWTVYPSLKVLNVMPQVYGRPVGVSD